MIYAVRSSDPRFKNVEFRKGLNIIIADRTIESKEKDSRNGLGKTTLIEIIHFCLGASAKKGKGIVVEPLMGWEFSLDIRIAGQDVTITRNISDPSKIFLETNFSTFPIQPKKDRRTGNYYLSVNDWNSTLGYFMFGLDIMPSRKYSPSFRSLISYFIRRGLGAYLSPFENFPKQLEWDKQVANSFLLDLQWEDASEYQILKDKEETLKKLKEANKTGAISDLLGSLGDLEAKKVRLENKYRIQKEQLENFKVHPQYKELEERANILTSEIHEASNENLADRQILSMYEKDIQQEKFTINPDLLVQLYEEVNVYLPDLVKKRLQDVKEFNDQLLVYQKNYLSEEIERLKREIERREELIQQKSIERSKLMEILNTHGALEEYNKLQRNHSDVYSELNMIEVRIENLKKFEQGRSSIKIEKELLYQRARLNYDERKIQRERAINFFNANSESLYSAPGKLLIDITDKGFKFNVDIERSGSEGIGHMKVFCYDLMLAQLWSAKNRSPGFLIHDSTIFDPVDERQVALALELAAKESIKRGFQYICTMNSDKIPWEQFSPDFDFSSYVRRKLTDATEDGGLLGFRY